MKKTMYAAGFCVAFIVGGADADAVTVTAFATHVYQQLYGLTTDGTALYVSGSTAGLRDYNGNFSAGVIGRIDFAQPGVLTTLYSSANYPTLTGHVTPLQIVADGAGGLQWADPDAGPGTGASFMAGTVTGGAASRTFATCCGPGVLPGDGIGVAIGATGLYFSDATGGRMGLLAGGATAQIGSTRYTPDFATESWAQIVLVGSTLYMADSAQMRGVDSSGRAQIYDVSATWPSGVRRISTDGTSGFVDVSVGKIDHPAGIVAVGGVLYVTSHNKVWQIVQSTGKTTVYAADKRFKDLQGITAAGGALYVADGQTSFGPFVGGIATAKKDGPGVIWKILP